MKIEENVSLLPLTTFQIGGNARYFTAVEKSTDLGSALDYAQTRKLPYIVLAGGSNVLVSDEGFDGLVIKINFRSKEVNVTDSELYAEAGASLMESIHEASVKGLSGMESMYGIPGTIGGAVRGNAGAFGTEVTDVVKNVTALNIATREIKTFTNTECQFGYRKSIFKKTNDWIILSATFSLKKDTPAKTLTKAEEILALRNERQIQNIKSAGSFFMNPVVNEELQRLFAEEKGFSARDNRVPAGWLIEKSGFKGSCDGDACTGARSSNYVINSGNATAVDVKNLTEKIRAQVLDDFGVELREEVTQIGF